MGKRVFVVALGVGAVILWMVPAQQSAMAQQAPATLASTVDRDISVVEKQIIDAAEAMPEEKFNFSPESLNISGSDYKGVLFRCPG